MPDQPLWKEFGMPMASDPSKTSTEIFDGKYGTYKCDPLQGKPGKAVSSSMEPKPFTNVK